MTPVRCRLCGRLCTSPTSRARRIGDKCWRKLRRQHHVQDELLPVVDVHVPGVS
ncbi:DUF6011 domain-containing protein [Micromonospora eburnea]|uniref:Uncharacterized protein n=1 Tax=Micromonospora eburnea TaxID=227316 RepID=A0A1C6TQ99_9ACTN|nr:DUF6011 domain-containing protein [Micromonospora eburnea]SCL43809.1 hypothetical protein GA0070604_0019 [Micromonospora eburnea]SCL43982.1 hypothetical protein GA0070604_0125 [Micromonospora eburnea]